MSDKNEIDGLNNFGRIGAGLVLGLTFVGMTGLVSVVYFPAFFLISASSPVIRWRVMNCHYDEFWMLIVETVVPYFLFGVVFGCILNLRPKFNIGYVMKAFLCFAISAGLVVATFEDLPSSNCRESRELSR